MRLVLMGTGPFGVPTFRGLYDTQHRIVAVVTAPVRSRPGREPAPISPVRNLAHEHNTPIYDPDDVNTPEAQGHLVAFGADLLVVCDYGQILSQATLATARLGGINLHASLLPKYRGAAPINWALYHGERETGVTVIHMTPRVDAGPCVAQDRTPIGPDETAVEVEARLAETGAALVRRTIDSMEAGTLATLPQNASQACKAPRLKKSDGQIDWTRPAAAIKNQIRALQPWPKCFTTWRREGGEPLQLIVGPVQVAAQPGGPPAAPGTVLEAQGDRLLVATGDGAVAMSWLQPAGKKPLPVAVFLNGYHVKPGQRFGPEDDQ